MGAVIILDVELLADIPLPAVFKKALLDELFIFLSRASLVEAVEDVGYYY